MHVMKKTNFDRFLYQYGSKPVKCIIFNFDIQQLVAQSYFAQMKNSFTATYVLHLLNFSVCNVIRYLVTTKVTYPTHPLKTLCVQQSF